MKYLLVRIHRGKSPDDPTLCRPPAFDARRISMQSTGVAIRDGGIGKGENKEEELWLVTDEYADELFVADSTGFVILDEARADAWLVEAARRRGDSIGEVFINSPERIQHVHAKLKAIELYHAGMTEGAVPPSITQADFDVLDPDKPEKGAARRGVQSANEVFRGKRAPV